MTPHPLPHKLFFSHFIVALLAMEGLSKEFVDGCSRKMIVSRRINELTS